ncbi:NAD(P)-dependent dehydrogenase (short-subunit alcohol dehydrogenase family) [Micromonospora pisi]|uniref:NAD(P)-dependent dehydrogenase (Short-subunit alcohol dehydrogenase family) n=1 Tax=Micromonospora pisi TaxID=589240 RepID=A0A495JDL2_9ACTN|nr:short-chain dehydrogenase [Micromonospora pisi]RKR86821.1 NAD(P)-dependent dehydrogenase (short-subunit alcohol dehydrogenase family) [Micromonospora pisi]
MRTVVIAGGTRGIGGALADKLRRAGDLVVPIGSADADLTSVRQTAALATRLPDKIDVLVLAAGRFDLRRIVTNEGFEQTFAIYVLSRYLLAERLRPALERAQTPIILNLSGTGGIRAGRIHWDDLQLTRGYTMLKATMQGARANDLLGAGFAAHHPHSQIRYVLYNPLFVNSGMHRQFRQPTRALVGASAALLGSSTGTAASRLTALLAEPPTARLTVLRRGTPVPLTRPEFDQSAAARLYTLLAELTVAS